MRRDEVLAILTAHRDELRETYGVKSLALFGSAARDEAGPDSDVDLLDEFDRRPVGLFEFINLKMARERLLNVPVDLATPGSLRARLRSNVERELVYIS
ncbi:MAG TPA: nucleotidyltransferase family protein [Thermomicrobiaceae bacterium]|nr:nucleotidyltransferase family protein [Thermomicrobiaceae bacterium]